MTSTRKKFSVPELAALATERSRHALQGMGCLVVAGSLMLVPGCSSDEDPGGSGSSAGSSSGGSAGSSSGGSAGTSSGGSAGSSSGGTPSGGSGGGAGAASCGDASNPMFGSCTEAFLASCFAPDLSGTCTSADGTTTWEDGSRYITQGAMPGMYGPGDATPCISIVIENGNITATQGSQTLLYSVDTSTETATITCPDGSTFTATFDQVTEFNSCVGINCPDEG